VASGWRNTLNISAHPYTAPLSLTHPVPKFPNAQNAQILVSTLKSCYQIHHTWHMHKSWELDFRKINSPNQLKVLSTRHNKASPLAHLSTNFPRKIKFQMQRKPKDNTQKRNCFYLQVLGCQERGVKPNFCHSMNARLLGALIGTCEVEIMMVCHACPGPKTVASCCPLHRNELNKTPVMQASCSIWNYCHHTEPFNTELPQPVACNFTLQCR